MTDRLSLIVDDTPANRDFLMRLIKQANFTVRGAATGQDALDYMYKDKLAFELFIIDMELPDMNGLQLTLRVREKYPQAMIVVATMHDDHSWIQKSFEMGCDLFLVKPHGFMELYKRLAGTDLSALRAEGQQLIDQYGVRPYRTVSRR